MLIDRSQQWGIQPVQQQKLMRISRRREAAAGGFECSMPSSSKSDKQYK
jgi:hypothetical protein